MATVHGAGQAEPSAAVKVVPAVVGIDASGTCRSPATASTGAGNAPTLTTTANPAGRACQLDAVGLASFAGVRVRIPASAAGMRSAGTVPVVSCAAENTLAVSLVLSTFPRPTIPLVIPETVPVNVGEFSGARDARAVACAATFAMSALSAGRSVRNCATLS